MTHDARTRVQSADASGKPVSSERVGSRSALNPKQQSAFARAEKLADGGVVRLADTSKETVTPLSFTVMGTLAFVLAIVGFFGNQVSTDLGGGLLCVWCMLVAIALASVTLIAVFVYELRHMRRRINRMVLIPMFAVFGLALLTALQVVIG